MKEPNMPDDTPVACSLDAADLKQRLDAIANVGAESLIDRSVEGGRHRLRFHANGATRQRLEAIVAAEAECCAFLDLSLREEGNDLGLSIAASGDGQVVADELARAFGERG
jgi:hypothetical protein